MSPTTEAATPPTTAEIEPEAVPLPDPTKLSDPPPPTIEIPHGEALEVLMDKPGYSDGDIETLVRYARKRRQEQAARELRLKAEAQAKADKRLAKEAKPKKGIAKNADEGKTPTTTESPK